MRWEFPNRNSLPIDLVEGVATGDDLFISGLHNRAVVLHRGPSHYSPDGEHCCTRNDNTLRICVTFSEYCLYNCLCSILTPIPTGTAPCPTLSPLSNGVISYDPDTNMATYSCDTGYNISGATSITCMSDGTSAGTWSTTPPTCASKT